MGRRALRAGAWGWRGCAGAWLGALASLAVAPRAGAQSTSGGGPDGSRVEAELGFYTHAESVLGRRAALTLVVPSVRASVHVASLADAVSLALDLDARAVGSTVTPLLGDDRTDLRAGNVLVGARASLRPIEGLRVRAGLGLVAPIVNAYDDGDVALVSVPATLLPNGGWDAWLASRGVLPIVVRGDAAYRDALWFVGGELGVGLGVPVLEGYEGAALSAQLGVWGGVRPLEGLALGGRVQAVLVDEGARRGGDPSAVGFVSVAPFVRGEFGGAFVEARAFASLADNDVYDAIGEKAWGLYVLVGADFDAR